MTDWSTAKYLPALELITSPYVGDLVTPEIPSRLQNWRGPYKQRKLKRWARRHPPWYRANGKVFVIDKRLAVCHPADLLRIRALVRASGLGE